MTLRRVDIWPLGSHLVPQQNSTGGKDRLWGITKQGNRYLRWLLVAGATVDPSRAEARHGEAAVAVAPDRAQAD
jgi:transposase